MKKITLEFLKSSNVNKELIEFFSSKFDSEINLEEFINLCLICVEQEKNYEYYRLLLDIWNLYNKEEIISFYSSKNTHFPINELMVKLSGFDFEISEDRIYRSLCDLVLRRLHHSIFGKKLIEFCIDYIPNFKKQLNELIEQKNKQFEEIEKNNIYD